MGVDLRRGRAKYSYERFKIYPANTNKKEILDNNAAPKGAFRGVGFSQEIHSKDEYGNIARVKNRIDGVETDDKIKIDVDDVIFNTYSKEFFIVVDWENVEDDFEIEFSTRPSAKKLIHLRQI